MSLKDSYRTSPDAARTGVWVEYPANKDKTIPRVKLARMSKVNRAYTKALNKATQPVSREIQLETLDEDKAEYIFLQVFLDTIMLDWENIQPDDDGKAIANGDKSAMRTMLADPEWQDWYDDLQEKAKKASLFRQAQLENDEKN